MKPNMSIDYYIIYYPRMVRTYYQCANRSVPIEPLADNVYDHVQKVIKVKNDNARDYSNYLTLKNLGIVKCIPEYFDVKHNADNNQALSYRPYRI